MFFFLSFFASSRPIKPLTNNYNVEISSQLVFDLSNIEEFTLITVKPYTVITIPGKKFFSAEASDIDGNKISEGETSGVYRFDFGTKTGKVVIRKLGKQSIFAVRAAVQTEDSEFKALLNKDVKLNEGTAMVATLSISIILGGFIIIAILFFCCCRRKPNTYLPRRFTSSSSSDHAQRTIVVNVPTAQPAPQYVPQPPTQPYPQPPVQPYQQQPYVQPQTMNQGYISQQSFMPGPQMNQPLYQNQPLYSDQKTMENEKNPYSDLN